MRSCRRSGAQLGRVGPRAAGAGRGAAGRARRLGTSSLTGQRKTRETHAVAGKRRNTPNRAGTRNSTGANGGQGGARAPHGV